MKYFRLAVVTAALLLTGCMALPTGPSMSALPGTGKGFDQFRTDDESCRHYAYDTIGGRTPSQSQGDTVAKSGVAGAVIGAIIGGAVNGGHGAAVGAGLGVAAGTLAGVGAGDAVGYEAQGRYDAAYRQCMYARGHRVPTNARYTPYYGPPGYPPPAARSSYPPPPPARYSYPPPPPPGAAPPPPPPGSAPPA